MSNAKPIFQKDDWVVQIRGRYRWRVGRCCEHPTYTSASDGTQFGTIQVQFGAGGPFQNFKFSYLRKADADEIPHGVG